MAFKWNDRLVGGRSSVVAISPATIPSVPFLTSSRNTSSRTTDESDSKTAVAARLSIGSTIQELLNRSAADSTPGIEHAQQGAERGQRLQPCPEAVLRNQIETCGRECLDDRPAGGDSGDSSPDGRSPHTLTRIAISIILETP